MKELSVDIKLRHNRAQNFVHAYVPEMLENNILRTNNLHIKRTYNALEFHNLILLIVRGNISSFFTHTLFLQCVSIMYDYTFAMT